jgi:hypothetical protein
MKCKYDDQVGPKIKRKDIYKYFFKKQEDKILKSCSIISNKKDDLDSFISNYPKFPWIELKTHKVYKEDSRPRNYGINLIEIRNIK